MVLCNIQQKDLKRKRFLSDLFGRPESLPVVLFILFFAILYGAGPELRSSKYVFEPPWLLFTLNTVFITGLGLLIAWLCFRSFLRGGFLNVLLLGCGVLAFGYVLLHCRVADPPPPQPERRGDDPQHRGSLHGGSLTS